MYRAHREIARALKRNEYRNESIDYLEYSLDNLKTNKGKILT